MSGQNLTLYANVAALNCGSSVEFVNGGSTSTMNVTDASGNTIIGHIAGTGNGDHNTGLGYQVLAGLNINGKFNTAVGYQSQNSTSSGQQNTSIGYLCLNAMRGGSSNVGVGAGALQQNSAGQDNVAIGTSAGFNYLTNESHNIAINNACTTGESNVLRIGNGTGTGTQQLAKAFISGINGVNVSSSTQTVVTMTGGSDQLGTAILTAGTNVVITPTANTITISANSGALFLNVTSVTTSPYVVSNTDLFLSVTTTSIAITIQLPNAPTTGRVFIIKDATGQGQTNNITLTTVGGVVLIDASSTYVMNTNYGSASVIFNGTNYEVF